jgi:CDP-diacylglycerol--serine O-phosphatidyltransferase
VVCAVLAVVAGSASAAVSRAAPAGGGQIAQPVGQIGGLGSFVLVACAALRLARFNVQRGSTEKKHFTGLPTPASALVIASMVLAYEEIIHIFEHLKLVAGGCGRQGLRVLALTFILAGLMVSNITYSLKEANLKNAGLSGF